MYMYALIQTQVKGAHVKVSGSVPSLCLAQYQLNVVCPSLTGYTRGGGGSSSGGSQYGYGYGYGPQGTYSQSGYGQAGFGQGSYGECLLHTYIMLLGPLQQDTLGAQKQPK